MVDASQLQNALLNLVLNARDAMPRGGRVTIEISQTLLDADYAQMFPEVRTGRYVLISVTDTGNGMPADVRQRAFEPFFTTKPAGAGTGLGLSMVYGFVRQSGGNVQLYSEPGQGTSVRIFLPAAAPAQRENELTAREAEATPLPRGSETILAVEDDARVRRVAIARLRSLGYQVIEAANGAAALALLSERPEIKMIFTDIVMPGGMSGDELAHAALVQRPDIKILLTSGYAEPAVASQGLRAGAWLKKPYTAAELARKIRSHPRRSARVEGELARAVDGRRGRSSRRRVRPVAVNSARRGIRPCGGFRARGGHGSSSRGQHRRRRPPFVELGSDEARPANGRSAATALEPRRHPDIRGERGRA